MKNNSKLQVAVFAPNKEREEIAIPIRIPVTGTLLSYRICLIRNGEQNNFSSVSNLDNLISSKLKIGSHQNWPDTTIMEANGLTLWKGNKYELLFTQLTAGRFDCFLRGANEIVQEYDAQRVEGLAIEQSVIIYYPLPFYYFVNKRNPELAKRITKGLTILINNGEYESMFKDKFSETLARLAIQDRKMIELSNPLLTQETAAQMEKDKERFKTLINNASL